MGEGGKEPQKGQARCGESSIFQLGVVGEMVV